MSRSYKKRGEGKYNFSLAKRWANKKVRKELKDNNVDLSMGKFKKAFCSWNISDYSSGHKKSFNEFCSFWHKKYPEMSERALLRMYRKMYNK